MPLYEFVCNKCSKKFEHLVLSDTDKDVLCPSCNSADITKQFSTFAAKSSSSDGSMPACAGSCGEMPSGCPSSRGGGCGCCGS